MQGVPVSKGLKLQQDWTRKDWILASCVRKRQGLTAAFEERGCGYLRDEESHYSCVLNCHLSTAKQHYSIIRKNTLCIL